MFKKILIANRGEIALRIIRACKELGIETVAVYSTADIDSLHVKMADEAICIGGPAGADSYLNIPQIISAAEITDVEAIHPGYGFLAENSHFAEVCESCHIKFIGPRPETIDLMGDKAKAKALAKQANVPDVPGSEGIINTQEEALKIAQKIGYPVLIKATAGGGGRGMRVAHNDVSLVNAFLTARNEAETAFNNPDVYMEKYIEDPRHIEVQIMADAHGNVIHLGERDCSVQRRHQKLIEESPCPIISEEMRQQMGEMAVKLSKKANYIGAGTVEFLLDKNKNFYFIEMNTRIQVEHTVSEVVTGIDLIKEQILVAAGNKLQFTQDDVKVQCHAIECRINAEDYEKNFMPCPGKITEHIPPGGIGVRVDTHVYTGYTIPPYYDSMIGKLITFGRNRDEAIRRMLRALSEYKIEGIKTSIPFQKIVLNKKDFQTGNFSTSFVDILLEELH